jgi:hypothetical protein
VQAAPGAKKDYCTTQSNLAFLAQVVPGGEYLFEHQMTAEVLAVAGVSIATDLIIDHKKDEIVKSATFLENLRAWFGVPKSLTPTIAGRASLLLSLYTGYKGTKSMQAAYKYCMEH